VCLTWADPLPLSVPLPFSYYEVSDFSVYPRAPPRFGFPSLFSYLRQDLPSSYIYVNFNYLGSHSPFLSVLVLYCFAYQLVITVFYHDSICNSLDCYSWSAGINVRLGGKGYSTRFHIRTIVLLLLSHIVFNLRGVVVSSDSIPELLHPRFSNMLHSPPSYLVCKA
jgi:hypothetical protein